MTRYVADSFGIWEVVKRDKSELEDLGFFNSYKGIENLRRLVVRLDKCEMESIELGFCRLSKLIDTRKLEFVNRVNHIDQLVKRAKVIFETIEDKEFAREKLLKTEDNINYAITVLRRQATEVFDNGDRLKIADILELKKEIEDVINRKVIKSINYIDDTPTKEIKDLRPEKHYTSDEVSYIVNNYKSIPIKDIAAELGRSTKAVVEKLRALRKEGVIN